MTEPLRVVGVDLSLTRTGVASSTGWCQTYGRTGVTTLPASERARALHEMAVDLHELIGWPDLLVVEMWTLARTAGGAGGAGERAGLYWDLLRRCARRGVPIAEVATGSLKLYATGRGGASKGQVIDAVARRWPAYETGGDDNLCDAITLAAMGADHLGHPLAPMPKTHRAALHAVDWPESTP